ncbi:MAG: hypothetical protein VB138_01845 [Burkholderia sp.]
MNSIIKKIKDSHEAKFLEWKYEKFLKENGESASITHDYFFFITTLDFENEIILRPKLIESCTVIYPDDPTESFIPIDFTGERICVAPSSIQCLVGLIGADSTNDNTSYKIYKTAKKVKAFKAINTQPASEEHYLFKPTLFKKIGEPKNFMQIKEAQKLISSEIEDRAFLSATYRIKLFIDKFSLTLHTFD